MSNGTRLPFAQALAIAQRLVLDVTPVVDRVKVAGSLRRRKPDVGDIELVVQPRQIHDLGGSVPDVEAVRAVARSWAADGMVAGKDRKLRVELPDGIAAELYLVHPPAQWGSILAIRTGPAQLGPLVMSALRLRGYEHVGGHVERLDTREVVSTATEEEFFALAGMRCLPPSRRAELIS